MVTGLVIWLLVRLYGYWFGYVVTGLVMRVRVLVIWLFVWLYGYRFGYMVIGFGYMFNGLFICLLYWLLVWLYGYWFGYMVIVLVIRLLV